MASRALAAAAKKPGRLRPCLLLPSSEQVQQPVIIHWLGSMFDPALARLLGQGSSDDTARDGYGGRDHQRQRRQGGWGRDLAVVGGKRDRHASVVCAHQRSKMYTGDDFNYAESIAIAGDKQGYSHALLGIFDAMRRRRAPRLLEACRKNDLDAFHQILAPTVPLSRHIFKAPTRFYKTGVVFLAYLNGFQDHFQMLGACRTRAPSYTCRSCFASPMRRVF